VLKHATNHTQNRNYQLLKMTEEENQIWNNIPNFEMDDIDSSFSFTDRLARENDWSIEYAWRAILE